MSNSISESVGQARNPFAIESPEKLTPDEVVGLFISDFTKIETVRQRKHTFIWGSRGSGKSMMFRYLEPACQAIVCGGHEAFLARGPEPFIGVHCPCKEGQWNMTELGLLSDEASGVVGEHLINLGIASRITDCLATQFPSEFIEMPERVGFAHSAVSLFDRASISSSVADADDRVDREAQPFEWLQAVLESETRKVGQFLRETALCGGDVVYRGATSGYHDFLLPLVRSVQLLPRLASASVYILLDDADRLTESHQRIVNTWIANRDHSVLCLKVSARHHAYATHLTRDGGLIEQPHDYSEVDVDELYTQSKSDYAERLRLIAERRLERSAVPTKTIVDFLPPDPTQEKLLEEIKTRTAEEWKQQGQPGRQRDYVYRYATARLFQDLAKRKQRRNYAGFDSMVHLSSGVVRDFLEPCYIMFDRCISRGADAATIERIPASVQDEVLREYSEQFVRQKLEDIREGLPPDEWTEVETLRTLIASLGLLFYERLHDPKAREARLFSFTVRDGVPRDLEPAMRLGVRHRYFQLRTYATKEGGGREPWYVLNRRVCPAFSIDPTGFEGRISLTGEMLRLACRDPHKFVRARLRTEEAELQGLLFPGEGGEDA